MNLSRKRRMLSDWSDTHSLGRLSHLSKLSLQSKKIDRKPIGLNIEEVLEEENADSADGEEPNKTKKPHR